MKGIYVFSLSTFFAQASAYSSSYSSSDDGTITANATVNGGLFIFGLIFILLLTALVIIGTWKVYTKAGRAGWASIVPIYNMVVWCQIVGRPVWWVLLLLVPVVGFVVSIILCLDMAKSFGKSTVYGILLWLFSGIVITILGFGKDQYVGPSADPSAPSANPTAPNGQPIPPTPAPTVSTSPETFSNSPSEFSSPYASAAPSTDSQLQQPVNQQPASPMVPPATQVPTEQPQQPQVPPKFQ